MTRKKRLIVSTHGLTIKDCLVRKKETMLSWKMTSERRMREEIFNAIKGSYERCSKPIGFSFLFYHKF
jgi:hypothetical protein